jgi:hypothetical protein
MYNKKYEKEQVISIRYQFHSREDQNKRMDPWQQTAQRGRADENV